MSKNKSNLIKWILAALSVFGILFCLAAEPFKWYHVVITPICLGYIGWYFGQVFKGNDDYDSRKR